jgi:hypothetical protein
MISDIVATFPYLLKPPMSATALAAAADYSFSGQDFNQFTDSVLLGGVPWSCFYHTSGGFTRSIIFNIHASFIIFAASPGRAEARITVVDQKNLPYRGCAFQTLSESAAQPARSSCAFLPSKPGHPGQPVQLALAGAHYPRHVIQFSQPRVANQSGSSKWRSIWAV